MVVDWALVTFNVVLQESRRAVEQASRLGFSAIKDVTWIKPILLCTTGQKTAIAIFKIGVVGGCQPDHREQPICGGEKSVGEKTNTGAEKMLEMPMLWGT